MNSEILKTENNWASNKSNVVNSIRSLTPKKTPRSDGIPSEAWWYIEYRVHSKK